MRTLRNDPKLNPKNSTYHELLLKSVKGNRKEAVKLLKRTGANMYNFSTADSKLIRQYGKGVWRYTTAT